MSVPSISDAEWIVMKTVWKKNPISTNQIVDALKETKWNHRTIRTLVSRLVKKKALSVSAKGRGYQYVPLVTQEECIKQERNSFLSKFYNGSLKHLVLEFFEDTNLSKKDIDDLRAFLNKKEGGGE